MAIETMRQVRVCSVEELERDRYRVVAAERRTILVLTDQGRVFALDNRCPHMGFPLHRGTIADGILTCHWHHARFDLCSGGTFDQFADDVRVFPVDVRDGDVYVETTPRVDLVAHRKKRLRDGLERSISLVIAKAAIALDGDDDVLRAGIEFGVERRGTGWGRGLTTLTCFANLVPRLDQPDRPAALYHGLADVAG